MGVDGPAREGGAPRADFVHLHVHSEYSLLDGAAQLEKIERAPGQGRKEVDVGLIARAAQLGFPALALTDHGNLFGAIDFYAACQQAAITPIIGCELYVAPGSRFERSPQDGGYEGASHATVLVRNETGYRNLIKLVSKAYLEGFYYKPRVDHELLAQHADGLLVLSGCLNSEVSKLLAAGEDAKALEMAGWYQEVFGKDFYFMEVQSHGIDLQARVTEATVRLARQIGAPLCGTNDSHYVEAGHARAHEALLCIQTGATMSDPNRWRFSTEEFYLKSADEMRAVFKDLPEAYRNTLAVSERCKLELGFGQFHLPNYDVPAGHTLDSYLEHLATEGLARRYGSSPPDAVVERLRYELSVVSKMGFSGYFLVVWDFIAYARGKGIAVGPGRGSSAGSLVAYCLGITNVDPVRYGLLFERFLNPERISMPDMDIDFADDRRDEVIRYVVERYGADRVAHIITFGTMGAKAVIRDVARVMGFSFGEADRIAKLVPGFPLNITLDEALEKAPALAEQVKRDSRVGELWAVARTLEGCTRHASVHASAVVISDAPLMDRVPLYKDPKRPELITGFAMGPIEKLGLLKMDFLGLRTLTVIADAARLVGESRGITLDPEALPLDDAKTYQLLSEARTFGVFQLESAGMRDALKSLRPTRIEDIIAMVSLYRPGPMELIPEFVNRKHGRAPITYEHPLMEKYLQETYGIMVYQEQVMGLAAELAGFTLGEADTLRKAMGKKDRELMAARPSASGISSRSSRGTGSTSRMRPVTASSPTRRRISRRTIPSSSWPLCSPPKWRRPTRSFSTWKSAAAWDSGWSRPPWASRAHASPCSARPFTSASPPSRTWAPPPSTRSSRRARREPSRAWPTSAGVSISASSIDVWWRAWSKPAPSTRSGRRAQGSFRGSTRPWRSGSGASGTATRGRRPSSSPCRRRRWRGRRRRRGSNRRCPSGPARSSSATRRRSSASISPATRSTSSARWPAASGPPPLPSWPALPSPRACFSSVWSAGCRRTRPRAAIAWPSPPSSSWTAPCPSRSFPSPIARAPSPSGTAAPCSCVVASTTATRDGWSSPKRSSLSTR